MFCRKFSCRDVSACMLPVCGTQGVSRGRGRGEAALTARHMEGCRFSEDRKSGILNAYLRCYRWRSQRQRILYKVFWKAALIFNQNCVYTRKQTKKEVCRLNPHCSLSLTHSHTCFVLYSRLHRLLFSFYCFNHKPQPNTVFFYFFSASLTDKVNGFSDV